MKIWKLSDSGYDKITNKIDRLNEKKLKDFALQYYEEEELDDSFDYHYNFIKLIDTKKEYDEMIEDLDYYYNQQEGD